MNTHDILVAHPGKTIREFLRIKLESRQFARVVAVESGRELIGALRRARFHAVIIPVEPDDIDCWRLTKMIRSGRFCTPSLPVITVHDYNDTHALTLLRELAKEHALALVSVDELDNLTGIIEESINTQAKRTVLTIEDDKRFADAVYLALYKTYDVEIQNDGEQGLLAWQRRRHDIVLLDVMLPSFSGQEVLSQIHAINDRQPIVIITAYPSPQRHEDLMMAGAIDFIEKPVDMNALQRICESAVQRSTLIASASEACRQADINYAINAEVTAAEANLSSGLTRAGLQHVQSALAVMRHPQLSEDQWSQLMDDFPEV